jgi:L-asparagine oxygenase
LLQAAKSASSTLPVPVLEELDRIAVGENDSGLLLVRGAEIGDIEMTPDSATARIRQAVQSFEWQALVIASRLGMPFSYPQEKSAQLFQDIIPVAGKQLSLSSESSATELTLHSEVAFHPYPPDHLLLMCVRADRNGEGGWVAASIKAALGMLPDNHVRQLGRPVFRTGLDVAFGGPSLTEMITPITSDRCRYDLELMTADDPAARAALVALDQAVAEAAVTIASSPGDILVVDNRYAAHGRLPFNARFDGFDRWILRILTRRDLPRADERTGTGVAHIHTRFSGMTAHHT